MRDEGLVKLCELTKISNRGLMPVERLVVKDEPFYMRMTVGITRRYAALGADKAFDTVIRVLNYQTLPDGVKYAVLEDGKQYRIDFTRELVDEDALELTLVRLGDHYDVTEQASEPVQSVSEQSENNV